MSRYGSRRLHAWTGVQVLGWNKASGYIGSIKIQDSKVNGVDGSRISEQ